MQLTKELFNKNRRFLFSIALNMTKSKQDADDMVQDTFLKFHDLRDIPVDPIKLLVAIIKNTCIDNYRSNRDKSEQYQENIHQLIEDIPYLIGYDRKLMYNIIDKSISMLCNRQSIIFRLRYQLGMRNKDIGELMGIKCQMVISDSSKAALKNVIRIARSSIINNY